MATPTVPTPLTTPQINPAVASTGAPAIPYLSPSQYAFAPTAIDVASLGPKGATTQQNLQVLADTIRRASGWADNYCFGADPAAKGASLAASLSVESALVRVRGGVIRLVCDYKPILEVVGVDVGNDPASASSIGPSLAQLITFGRRTITVPFTPALFVGRVNDQGPGYTPAPAGSGRLYATWSYVNGYPHTTLAAPVTAGATTCQVTATDGAGGLWGVYPASGAFPGTGLTIWDGANTETIYVQTVTPGANTTTLTTTAFANAHTPPPAPDFLPVSALPADVNQALVSLTTCLIKTRGARALVLPQAPGGLPTGTRQAFAQAGALEDYEIATAILDRYTIRVKAKH